MSDKPTPPAGLPKEPPPLTVGTIEVAAEDWDDVLMYLTGTSTPEEAERARAMGPDAWRKDQASGR